jgi:pimeloyl-ACP methyl ester carboxylesterase
MGVDARIFGPQRAAGLEFESPPMPMPEVGDDLARYARRIRDQLGLDGPCVVGGMSMGGMVACELARITQARCVLLIASCSHRRAIPSYCRLLERVSRIIPDFLIRRRAAVSARMMSRIEGLSDEQYRLIHTMATAIEVTKLRRFARMILTWEAPRSYPCPIYQIHGERDLVIPLGRLRPEVVVSGGGHLINMTHAGEVNAFVRRYLERA